MAKKASYENIVTVAVINYQTIWGNKQANLEKIKSIATSAAEQGNNIIVFPELALCGYESDDKGSPYKECAETIPGPATEEIASLAKKKDVYIIWGMAERDRKSWDLLYNSAVMVGPEGYIGTFRKMNPSPPPLFSETDFFTGGSELPVFETRYGLVGIQICRDFWFYPEQSRILALKGARLLINSTASPAGPNRAYFVRQATSCRATENLVFAATSNLVGKELVRSYSGHSCIAGPDPPRIVNVFAEGGEDEEIVSATLNFHKMAILHDKMNLLGGPGYQLDVIAREFEALKRSPKS